MQVLRLVDDTGYRRDIKAQADLQEGRHVLARRIFHGQRGELRQRREIVVGALKGAGNDLAGQVVEADGKCCPGKR